MISMVINEESKEPKWRRVGAAWFNKDGQSVRITFGNKRNDKETLDHITFKPGDSVCLFPNRFKKEFDKQPDFTVNVLLAGGEQKNSKQKNSKQKDSK